jgi:hypothetical protein
MHIGIRGGKAMPKTFDEVLDDVYELSPEDFEKLKLVLNGPPPTLHPAWGPELRRRLKEIQSGKAELISVDEVKREIAELLAAPSRELA